MANFEFAYSLLIQAEYGGFSQYFLHKNRYEDSLTCGGIYKKHNEISLNWDFIYGLVYLCGYDIEKVCRIERDIDEIKNSMELMDEKSKLINEQKINELEFERKEFKEKLKRASTMIYSDEVTRSDVSEFFKKHYWDISRLSEVHSQKIANEIFLMSVVSGVRVGVRLAQELIGTKQDGIVGNYTLKALNNFNESVFDVQYDNFEKRHFDTVIEKNPHLKINKKGWYFRLAIA